MISYNIKPFSNLDPEELYQLIKLRSEVFVVEQACIYQDLDDKDQSCWHILGYDAKNELVAYARIVPPNLSYAEPSIGRVLVKMTQRKTGSGQSLMHFAIEQTKQKFPSLAIRISAQAYLESFYQNLGFTSLDDRYLEDGIPHLGMIMHP